MTLGVRNAAAGLAAARDITVTTGNDGVHVTALDLADQGSVAALVGAWDEPLDILVNNAGIMSNPEAYTTEGREVQLATNHLGHFALALGLYDALAAADGARIVSVSSSGHGDSPVVLDDLLFDRRPYDAGAAYGQSKTAGVLFTVEANRRWATDGITANAQVPATDASGMGVKTPEQGAATSVLMATWPGLAGIGGRHFEDCHEAEVVTRIPDGLHGVCAYALDPAAAARLWDVSVLLIAGAGGRSAVSV